MENCESKNVDLTPPQLKQLFELFLACREMESEARTAWLRKACKGDIALERAVENLVREDVSADGFLSRPMNFLTSSFSFVIAEGERFGRYTITGFLGRGGMGEVWKAHDEELDRAVALKFIHASFAANQLTREARMASALNHPGIVTVYDVALWQGTPILVMELVTGTPLSRFCNAPMSVNQLIRIGVQSSSALASAHAEGMVHGDLKPDNIIWRPDELAKILDFGLARRTADAGAAEIAGTPLYMSPEQARGDPVGTASDVYSLGLVLYELASAQRPFVRQSLDQIAARQARPPRVSRVRTGFPEKLDDLIDGMLEVHPAKRIGMLEVAGVLLGLERPPKRHWIWKLAAVAVLLLVAVASIVWWRTYQEARLRIDISHLTVRPLASQPGLEDNPSISPDGLWISCLYRAREADRPQLQVHSAAGGPPVVIATGELVVQRAAAWSPDSSELAFSALEGSREHFVYRVHRRGGVPKRIAACRPRDDKGCEIDWSPDGKMLAVADRLPNNSELYLLELSNGRRRDLVAPDKLYVTTPRFSPDGKWIAYMKEPSMVSNDLYVIASVGGPPRRITRRPWFLTGFAWSTEAKSLLAFSSGENNKPQLRQFSLDGKEPHALAELDAGRGSSLSLSRGKGTFAWVRDLSVNSLWRMPTNGSSEPPRPLVNSAAVDIDAEWSSTGRMVFRSDRSGVTELWIANADGTSPWQATRFRGPFVGDPHWSPDGHSIAFTSRINGNPDIFVMRCSQDAAACGPPRQLTRSPAPDANPIWSGDGRFIYFSSSRSGEFEVWRLPADGTPKPERMTWNGGYLARESKDGNWLYFSKLWEATGFWRIPLPARGPGQTEIPVALNVPFKAGATWTLGSHELFYYPAIEDPAISFPPVRAVDTRTGRGRDLPVGNIRLGRGLSLSPDERWLLRSQNDRALTLIMIAE